ncbi:aminotransferase class V-fold PLP-dependent enzyme [Candidatus Bathyarchaeota archaeon]|nr:aminotransferase class V-fold PLP-dependent enzyme [Candidatus Bathyarchaeota archaeon]
MKLKESFPLAEKLVYFDNAVMGCAPQSTLDTMKTYTDALVEHMSGKRKWAFNVEEGKGSLDTARELFAKVIGSKKEEVLGVPNASTGMNVIMSMLPIKKGDNIVSTDLAFPMGAALVQKGVEKGAEARWLPNEKGVVETAAFEKAIDDNTAIVYLDQPSWFNGYLFDIDAIAELAHDHGAYFVVDATQSMGAIDWQIDKTGVDFSATSTFKWLLGGIPASSAGFLYMKEEHIDRYPPEYVSGCTYKYEKTEMEGPYMGHKFNLNEGIGKYGVFRSPDFTFKAAANSMKVLLDHGMKEIEGQNKKLATKIIDELLARGYTLQTPVEKKRRSYLNVKVPDIKKTVETLNAEDYWCCERVGGIRISPHFYNTIEQADRFIERLDKAVKSQ